MSATSSSRKRPTSSRKTPNEKSNVKSRKNVLQILSSSSDDDDYYNDENNKTNDNSNDHLCTDLPITHRYVISLRCRAWSGVEMRMS